jgi:hypothetical protein
MLTRVKEMIDEFNSRPNASAGFTAKEVYEVGKTFGLTCREIGQTFLGKDKSIGYSRYLPQMPPAEVIAAAMKAGPKKRGRKPGAAKKVFAEVVPEVVEKANDEIPSSSEGGEVFCWIASPQEIAEEFESPAPVKAKKPRKVKRL